MRKILAIVYLLSSTFCIAQTVPTLGTAHSIVSTWSAPVGIPSGLTLTGYTLTINSPAGGAPIVVPQCTGTSTTNCIATGALTATWAPVPGPLYYGAWPMSLVANYVNTAGTVVISSPATATAVYAPSLATVGPAPGGFSIVFK
jgi:hypothetical protein